MKQHIGGGQKGVITRNTEQWYFMYLPGLSGTMVIVAVPVSFKNILKHKVTRVSGRKVQISVSVLRQVTAKKERSITVISCSFFTTQ